MRITELFTKRFTSECRNYLVILFVYHCGGVTGGRGYVVLCTFSARSNLGTLGYNVYKHIDIEIRRNDSRLSAAQ